MSSWKLDASLSCKLKIYYRKYYFPKYKFLQVNISQAQSFVNSFISNFQSQRLFQINMHKICRIKKTLYSQKFVISCSYMLNFITHSILALNQNNFLNGKVVDVFSSGRV